MNLQEFANFESVEEMERHTQDHIYFKGLKGNVKKVLICIKQYSKLNSGACKLKADTIADKTSTSRSTVMRALKVLLELRVIEKENGTKLNGIKGASIYFILPFADTSSLAQRDTSDEAIDINVSEPKKETEYIISLKKSFKTSTLKQIYLHAYEHEEFLNQYQKALYELMNSVGVNEIIGDELGKVIAATEINSVEEFHIAKEIIMNIALDLQSGRLNVDTTLRAIYKGAYNKKMARSKVEEVKEPVELSQERTVPFYNWLEEREVMN